MSVTKDDDAFAFPNNGADGNATAVAAAAAAAYNAGDVSFDGIHAVCLGKGLALLLMGIVMAINDEADAIGAELVYGGSGASTGPRKRAAAWTSRPRTTYATARPPLRPCGPTPPRPPCGPSPSSSAACASSALTSRLSRFQYFSPSSASCCAGCCISGESSAWSMEQLARLLKWLLYCPSALS